MDDLPARASTPRIRVLSAADKALLLDYLRSVARDERPCPGVATLADVIGCGETPVVRFLQSLEDDGTIKVERRTGGRRRLRIDACWTAWSGGRSRRAASVKAPVSDGIVDQARRHLMSRDHTVVGAGPGLFKINGRVRSLLEMLEMANRSLMSLGRSPLDGTAPCGTGVHPSPVRPPMVER